MGQDLASTIEWIKNENISLVFLAEDYANFSPLEFLQILKEKKLDIPCLFYCTQNRAKNKQEALRLGIYDFIEKKISPTNVFARVEDAIRNYQYVDKSLSRVFAPATKYSELQFLIQSDEFDLLGKICDRLGISQETYIRKALQRAMSQDLRNTNQNSEFWNKRIITGVDWIDDQHYLLLLQIQEISDLYSGSADHKTIADIFVFLKHYVDTHFQQEEQMFHLLPDLEQQNHLAQHNHFRTKMHELRSEIEKSVPSSIVQKLAKYCQRWFINHIENIDQSLAHKIKSLADESSKGELNNVG